MQFRLSLLAAALLTTMAFQQPAPAQQSSTLKLEGKQMIAQSTTLACNMDAMTPAQRMRHEQLMEVLRRLEKEVKDLPLGYALRYNSDPKAFMAAAEFITLESRCCPFYHFRLEQEQDNGAVWLTVTGPKDAKGLIKAALVGRV